MKTDTNFDRLVFDNEAWGGKDVGDNSVFWRVAKVIKVYRDKNDDLLCDVIFKYDGRLSRGHFYHRATKPLPVSD